MNFWKWLSIGIIVLCLIIIAWAYFHPKNYYSTDSDLTYEEVKYATEMRHNGRSDVEVRDYGSKKNGW